MKCLVTGADGFIGSHLVRHLLAAGHDVRAASSSPEVAESPPGKGLENVRVMRNALHPAEWQAACEGMDTVFHLAGRAHRGGDFSPAVRQVYFQDNLERTRALAEAAVKARVRRFVFASSVTVFGTASPSGEAFREDSPAAPHANDAYAQSKLAAEDFLLSDDVRATLEPIIVRLPLVYGAGVRGNMAALMRLVQSGLPLPLDGIDNRRSFINIPNCVDFLLTAATHPDAAGRVLLTSDQEDVSTPELIRMIAREQGKSARLFHASPAFLKTVAFLLGQKARLEKLASNFRVDPLASCALLDWSPKAGLAEGIAEMCAVRKE